MTVKELYPHTVYGSEDYVFDGKVRFERFHLGSGSTRHVYRIGKYAVKVPNLNKRPTRWRGMFLRGVLANRSEWKQRKRHDVVRPLATLFWIIQVYPKVDPIPDISWNFWDKTVRKDLIEAGYSKEESKPSSWCFGPNIPVLSSRASLPPRYLLIDYDRCWDEPMGWLGKYQEWRDEWIYSRYMKGKR